MDNEEKVIQESDKEEKIIQMYESIFNGMAVLQEGFMKLEKSMDHLIAKVDKQDKLYMDVQEKLKSIALYIDSNNKRDFDIDKLTCDIGDVKKDVLYMFGKFYNKIQYLETFIDKQNKIIRGREKSDV